MQPIAITCLVVFASSLINTAFVFFSSPRNPLKLLWGMISLIVAFIGIHLFWLVTAPSKDDAYFHSLTLNMALILIPILFFHFTLLLTNNIERKQRELIVYYIITLIYTCVVMFYPRLFIPDVGPVLDIKYYCQSGPLFYFLPVWMSFLMSYGLCLVYRSFSTAPQIKRNQLKYFFVGCAFGMVGGVESLLPAMNVPVHPWGLYLVPICLLVVAYAVARHQLMNIQIVFHKGLVYTLLISILTVIFFLCAFIVQKIFQNMVGNVSQISTLISVILIALLTVPLYHFAQFVINQMFYKGKSLTQMADENLRLQQEMLVLGRYKTFMEIAQRLPDQIHANLNDLRKIEEITNELSLYSQVQPMDFKDINLISILDQSVNAIEPQLKSKGVEIFRYYRPKSLIKIHGNAEQLAQTIDSLFGIFAQTAQKNDNVFVSAEPQANHWASISIRYSDLKLTPDEVSQLFQPFFKSKHINCGLRLVLAQSIIDQHGGKIWIEPNKDGATEFLIELPLV